jgi:hypothetical protein
MAAVVQSAFSLVPFTGAREKAQKLMPLPFSDSVIDDCRMDIIETAADTFSA